MIMVMKTVIGGLQQKLILAFAQDGFIMIMKMAKLKQVKPW